MQAPGRALQLGRGSQPLEIESETLARTIHCREGFACLVGQHCCSVESCIGGTILFVRRPPEDVCYYAVHFGDGCLCSCPTRKELYSRYGM